MRKIASNYIYLPGYPLIKNGYVILDDKKLIDLVDTGGVIREIPALEFYGGMIIDGSVQAGMRLPEEDHLFVFLDRIYSNPIPGDHGIAIIEGADLRNFTFTENTRIRKI